MSFFITNSLTKVEFCLHIDKTAALNFHFFLKLAIFRCG